MSSSTSSAPLATTHSHTAAPASSFGASSSDTRVNTPPAPRSETTTTSSTLFSFPDPSSIAPAPTGMASPVMSPPFSSGSGAYTHLPLAGGSGGGAVAGPSNSPIRHSRGHSMGASVASSSPSYLASPSHAPASISASSAGVFSPSTTSVLSPLHSTLPSPATQRSIADARAALVASMGNLLDSELQSRGQSLHAAEKSIAKQEKEVERGIKGLRKENDKLMKVVREAGEGVKMTGNVQHFAETLEREFMRLEEVVRIVRRGEGRGGGGGVVRDEDGDYWSGSGSYWSGSGTERGDGDGDDGDDGGRGGDGSGRHGDLGMQEEWVEETEEERIQRERMEDTGTLEERIRAMELDPGPVARQTVLLGGVKAEADGGPSGEMDTRKVEAEAIHIQQEGVEPQLARVGEEGEAGVEDHGSSVVTDTLVGSSDPQGTPDETTAEVVLGGTADVAVDLPIANAGFLAASLPAFTAAAVTTTSTSTSTENETTQDPLPPHQPPVASSPLPPCNGTTNIGAIVEERLSAPPVPPPTREASSLAEPAIDEGLTPEYPLSPPPTGASTTPSAAALLSPPPGGLETEYPLAPPPTETTTPTTAAVLSPADTSPAGGTPQEVPTPENPLSPPSTAVPTTSNTAALLSPAAGSPPALLTPEYPLAPPPTGATSTPSVGAVLSPTSGTPPEVPTPEYPLSPPPTAVVLSPVGGVSPPEVEPPEYPLSPPPTRVATTPSVTAVLSPDGGTTPEVLEAEYPLDPPPTRGAGTPIVESLSQEEPQQPTTTAATSISPLPVTAPLAAANVGIIVDVAVASAVAQQRSSPPDSHLHKHGHNKRRTEEEGTRAPPPTRETTTLISPAVSAAVAVSTPSPAVVEGIGSEDSGDSADVVLPLPVTGGWMVLLEPQRNPIIVPSAAVASLAETTAATAVVSAAILEESLTPAVSVAGAVAEPVVRAETGIRERGGGGGEIEEAVRDAIASSLY